MKSKVKVFSKDICVVHRGISTRKTSSLVRTSTCHSVGQPYPLLYWVKEQGGCSSCLTERQWEERQGREEGGLQTLVAEVERPSKFEPVVEPSKPQSVLVEPPIPESVKVAASPARLTLISAPFKVRNLW